jgi:hypothetical protein
VEALAGSPHTDDGPTRPLNTSKPSPQTDNRLLLGERYAGLPNGLIPSDEPLLLARHGRCLRTDCRSRTTNCHRGSRLFGVVTESAHAVRREHNSSGAPLVSGRLRLLAAEAERDVFLPN